MSDASAPQLRTESDAHRKTLWSHFGGSWQASDKYKQDKADMVVENAFASKRNKVHEQMLAAACREICGCS